MGQRRGIDGVRLKSAHAEWPQSKAKPFVLRPLGVSNDRALHRRMQLRIFIPLYPFSLMKVILIAVALSALLALALAGAKADETCYACLQTLKGTFVLFLQYY